MASSRKTGESIDLEALRAKLSEKATQLDELVAQLKSTKQLLFSIKAGEQERESVRFNSEVGDRFSSIKISAYKRLIDLSLNRVSRINLVTGMNNTGKTSLLEAIYLLCRQNDFSGLSEVHRRRGKIALEKLDPEWYAQQLHGHMIIAGVFNLHTCSVHIQPGISEKRELDKARYLKSVTIKTSAGDKVDESIMHLFKNGPEIQAERIQGLCPSVFSSPFFLNEPHHYATFYRTSVLVNLLPKVIEFLKSKMVPTLTDIRLVDEWQRFLVNDSRFEMAQDLASYGEGLQRVFFTSLMFAAARNGVLLIDEVENAIHTGLIPSYAQFIAELAKAFNVQVFLTSHSKECIDAFVLNIPDPNELSACALVEEDGQIAVREFSGPEFREMVESADVDLRSAR